MQRCGDLGHRHETFVTSLTGAQPVRARGLLERHLHREPRTARTRWPGGGGPSAVRAERPDAKNWRGRICVTAVCGLCWGCGTGFAWHCDPAIAVSVGRAEASPLACFRPPAKQPCQSRDPCLNE